MTLTRFTRAFIVASITSVLAVDYAVYRVGGNASTISRVLEAMNEHDWYIAGAFSYAAAGLMVHLFLPNYTEEESAAVEWARATIFFVPVLFLMAILCIADPDAKPLYTIQGVRDLYLLAEMTLSAIAGGTMAKLFVPQHLPPILKLVARPRGE